jgi:DNA-binding transcriptional regulator YiaG
MSYKTASKAKGKAAHVEVASFGKKAGGPKTIHFGGSGKLYGLKPKAAVGAGKSKAVYGPHVLLDSQLHDAGHAVHFAASSPTELETMPLEQETELADKLVAEVADSSADVNELCETYRLKREELGRLTGFSLRALAEWASGKLPSQPAKRRLQEVRRLLDALAEIVKRESIPKWLHQPNAAFGRLTPLQVIELGEIDRLWAMVHDMGSGQPE